MVVDPWSQVSMNLKNCQSQLQSELQVCCSKLVAILTYFISPLGTDSQGKEMRLGSRPQDEGSESSAFGEQC